MKKKLVFITGAGISAESGIRTFRDSDGLWEEYPVEQVASIQGYRRDRELVIRFYNERRKQLLGCKPNDAHRLVAELEKDFDVTVVTQNVDDLHERAGSTKVIHLHGELMKATSSNNPNDPKCIVDLPADNPVINIGDKAKDGSQLRPYIVWFGEPVPNMEPAILEVAQADIVVIVGTSLKVYPAAGLVSYTHYEAKIFLIDPHPANVDPTLRVHVIKDVATSGMRQLVDLLKEQA